MSIRPLLPRARTTTALLALVLTTACVRPTRGYRGPSTGFSDNFDRAELGPNWSATAPAWSIVDGHMHVRLAHNHPVWLRQRIPRDARIEFDAWTDSNDGDIKCEVWGDGHTFATEDEYTASSYVVIMGGWFNRLNVIARGYEHGHDRAEQPVNPRVVAGQHYHWVIERRGEVLTWSVDGRPMLELRDAHPFEGPGHEYFAFNDWANEDSFDNLVITPL